MVGLDGGCSCYFFCGLIPTGERAGTRYSCVGRADQTDLDIINVFNLWRVFSGGHIRGWWWGWRDTVMMRSGSGDDDDVDEVFLLRASCKVIGVLFFLLVCCIRLGVAVAANSFGSKEIRPERRNRIPSFVCTFSR